MIQEIVPPPLLQLRDYFERLGDRFHTGLKWIQWYFEIRLFEINVTEIALNELIKFAYPTALPDKAQITTTTFYDFQETLDYKFTTGYFGDLPIKAVVRRDRYFSYLLNECLHYKEATIYEYNTQEVLDPLGAAMFRRFTFILLNIKQRRLLILNGAEWD
jgi:hypothetical protein